MSDFITQPVRQRERILDSRTIRDDERDDHKTTRLAQKALALLGIVALVGMVLGFVKPILMAGLFGATLYPYHLKLRSKIKSNNLRAGLLTLGFAVLFLLPVGAVVFMAASAGVKKFKDLPDDWAGKIQIEPLLDKLEGYLPFERAELVQHVEQAATMAGKFALSVLQSFVAGFPKLLIVNFVILIGVYVILSQAPAILNWFRRLSPLSDASTEKLFKRVGGLSKSSVLATIVSGAVQALIIGIALLIMQVPGALLITMVAFVLSFIPIIGTAPVALYLVATAAIAGDWTRVTIFVVLAGIVGVSDNIVRPFVLSDSAKLHGFIAFIAAVGALETMGFYGLFLGPVVAGTVLTLVELVQKDRTA